jgi:hypothetical protein
MVGRTARPPLDRGRSHGQLGDVHRVVAVGLYGSSSRESKLITGLIHAGYFYSTLPVKLAWAAAAFMFLGGGPTVGVSLVHAIAADGLPDGMLSTYLLAQRSTLTLAHVGALALGGYLMSLHLWIPVFVGLPFYILGLCLLPLIPETRHWGHNRSSRNGGYTAVRTSGDPSDPGPTLPPASESPLSALAALKGSIILPLTLLRHVPTALFLSIFLLGAMTTASLSLLPQHLSTILSLPFSNIPYVESYRSLVSGLLLLLLPVAIHQLRAHGTSPTAIDLGITQLSLVLLGTSFLALAAAGASMPGVAVAIGVQAASAGFFDASKAWYVGVGAAREVVGVTGLFVAVGMVARTGAMVGDPVWAASWAWLIKIHWEWMLWVLAAGGCTCMGLVLWVLVGHVEREGWKVEMDMDMDMETRMEMEMEADTERKK